LLDEIRAAYQLQAMQRGVTPATGTAASVTVQQRSGRPATLATSAKPSPTLTAAEQEAANLIVELPTPAAPAAGGAAPAGRGAAGAGAPGAPAGRGAGGGGAGGGGGRQGGGRGGPSLPTEYNAEFSAILGRKMTALEIRDFLSGEFEPVPLADVMAVLRAREAAGSIKLVPKPAPTPVRRR
jgi:aminopeptidase YwaD